MIGVFVNNELRIIDENCNFQYGHQEEVNKIVVNDEINQLIVSDEAISATDAHAKNGNMEGVYEIADFCESASMSKIM